MDNLFREQLQALRNRSLHRKLQEIGSPQGAEVAMVGRRLVNFSSNDYLGLANSSLLREAAAEAISEFGVGAGASRLISGTQSPHVQLESALSKWKGTPAALCFGSGYAAAVGTIPAIVQKSDVVVLDKLSHASLIDGAKLSGATLRVFPHNHLGKLESHLDWARRERPNARVLIVTESVFSMDGDRAPLRELVELKKRFGVHLLLDEAHAIGVVGANGRGLAAEEECDSGVDVQMGTLSKALGVSGGYICGSRNLIEWLVNRARSFIFTTAPPAVLAATALAAVRFLSSSEGERRRELLWNRIKTLREFLPSSPRPKPVSSHPDRGSAIHAWIIGDEQTAVDMSSSLRAENFLVPAIRYPTVAKGSARLRITVTADHDDAQIRSLCEAMARFSS